MQRPMVESTFYATLRMSDFAADIDFSRVANRTIQDPAARKGFGGFLGGHLQFRFSVLEFSAATAARIVIAARNAPGAPAAPPAQPNSWRNPFNSFVPYGGGSVYGTIVALLDQYVIKHNTDIAREIYRI